MRLEKFWGWGVGVDESTIGADICDICIQEMNILNPEVVNNPHPKDLSKSLAVAAGFFVCGIRSSFAIRKID